MEDMPSTSEPTAPLMDAETLTVYEAALLCKVSRRSIYSWITQNKVKYIKTAGGRRRIIKSSLFREGNVESNG